MYSKAGQPKWILVSQMLKLVRKWSIINLFLALYACICAHTHTSTHTFMYMCVIEHSISIGYLFHFGFLCFLGYWCFHLFHLFHGLAFPYQAKYWMDSRKIRRRIHITEVFIVLVCGSLPPTVTIIVSDYHYDGVLCSPQSSYVLFYGEALPYIVTFLVGLIFLFSCLWILRNVS